MATFENTAPAAITPAKAESQFSAGAAEFQSLMAAIGHISGATCDPDTEGDARDYEAITAAVLQSISANLNEATGDHRAGFAQALGYLLCCAADGCLPSTASARA